MKEALWLQAITCNGNAHSFFNSPDLPDLTARIRWLYHPLLPSKHTLQEIVDRRISAPLLVIEGALGGGFDRAGEAAEALIVRCAEAAEHILCVGNCAVFGGVFRQRDPKNLGGAIFCGEQKGGLLAPFEKKIINLPGCPIHPQWLALTLRSLLMGRMPALDRFRRPVELYGYTVHEGCLRNEYFEWKVDAESFGRKEGCLFYEQGCRGPYTRGSCNKILWNETSSKTRAGMPCIGCTEPDFPASGLFRTHTLMSIPARLPLEVPKRAYLTLTGVAKAFKIPRLTRGKFEEDS